MSNFSDMGRKHVKHHNRIKVTYMVLVWLVYHFHDSADISSLFVDANSRWLLEDSDFQDSSD